MSKVLRKATQGYVHWCPGCLETHCIPTPRWEFDGNLESPTFKPSVNISYGNNYRCHYVLTAGQLQFIGDCTHALKGQTVPLPPLPDHLMDDDT